MLQIGENNEITIVRGNTETLALTITDGEGQEYDFSNDTVEFGVKRSALCNGEALLKKTFDENGEIHFSHDDTAEMEFGDYLYEVRLTHVDEAETEGEEDVVTVKSVIPATRFTVGWNIL